MRLLDLRIAPILGIVAYFWAGTYAQDLTSVCHAPSVYKGQKASVTCVFSEDLRNRHIDFRIYRGTVPVLGCYWKNETDVACDEIAPGYSFDYVVGTNVTVTIPTATEDFIGNYQCQAESNDFRNADKCSFTLKEGAEPQSGTSSTSGESVQTPVTPLDTSESPTQNSSTALGESDQQTSWTALVIVIVIVTVTVTVIVVVAVTQWRYRKRIRRRLPCLWCPCTDAERGPLENQPAEQRDPNRHRENGAEVEVASNHEYHQPVEMKRLLEADSSEITKGDAPLCKGTKPEGTDDKNAIPSQLQPIDDAKPKGDATTTEHAAQKRDTTPKLQRLEDPNRSYSKVQSLGTGNNEDSNKESEISNSQNEGDSAENTESPLEQPAQPERDTTPTVNATTENRTPKSRRKEEPERFVTAKEFLVTPVTNDEESF